MPKYDFILTWDWEYDAAFIEKFALACQQERLTALFVDLDNIDAIIPQVVSKELQFNVLLDRASDTDEDFDPLIDHIVLSGTNVFNKMSHALHSMDKATMHLEFLSGGIDVPFTVIISDKDDIPQLEKMGIDKLGSPFIIKPATGGGGQGVLTIASIAGIPAAREEFDDEKYLVQEKIIPAEADGQRIYFRIYYVCGHVIPCWWHNETHVFGHVLTQEEETKYELAKIKDIVRSIAEISKLDFFSTELCKTARGRLVVVDYVNDPVDMRPRSTCFDGVPDEVIDQIITHLISQIKKAQWRELTSLERELLLRQREFELRLLRYHR